MSLLLYINGQQADLEPGQAIAQTKQVNDLNSIENRQAGYTNKFKLPKTAANLKIMQFLTVPGNTSGIPYRHNECSLYSDSGECFVYKGRAVITDGGDDFEAVIYDGIIDLYKAIENTPISVVGLQDLDHVKSVNEVKNSWLAANPPFRYILADYNGDTGSTNTTPAVVNIDYLVPAVNIKYLWEKIFNHYGFSYSGSVFDTEKFKNLWMTFPKGISTGDNETELFTNSYNLYPGVNVGNYVYTYYTHMTEYEAQDGVELVQNRHIKVTQPGYYRLEIDGSLKTETFMFTQPRRAKVFIGRNSHNLPPNAVQQFEVIADNIHSQHAFSGVAILNLNAYDSVCVMIAKATNETPNYGFVIKDPTTVNVRLVKVNQNEYNFSEALSDFAVKDLLTEVVHRFGLTIFKDKYSNHYDFLTLQEQLQSPQVLDWSGKFVKKISENYIYGSYARRNWMRYAYNDKESSHYDGYIDVQNVNLPDNRDIIKSKIYAPERAKSLYLNRPTNVYKLWDKEVVENPGEDDDPVKYKSLDKRYYFLRGEYSDKDITLHSVKLQQTQQLSSCYVEQYWKLPFSDIADDYYNPLRQILEQSLIVNAEMFLQETDVTNFDFRKLIYIEQLSSYFLMNKINNYVPGKPVKCELVRIQFSADEATPQQSITITAVYQIIASMAYSIFFTLNNFTLPEGAALIFKGSSDNIIWEQFDVATAPESPHFVGTPFGYYPYWRIECPTLQLTSNTFQMN